MEITSVRHSWPESAGFELNRPNGAGEYIMLYFHSAAELFFSGKWCDAPAGAFIVLAPDEPHSIRSKGPLMHDWMHIRGSVERELDEFGIEICRLYHLGNVPAITDRMARLEAEFLARENLWQRSMRAILDELWIIISREISGRAQIPVMQETATRLRGLRAEMILHPERPWTNADMARQLNISVSRLYPLYRRLFSISPGQDLILMRTEKAKRLLQSGNSVSQVSEMLGYGSIYHFIRQFRQSVGMTPGKWAASNANTANQTQENEHGRQKDSHDQLDLDRRVDP